MSEVPRSPPVTPIRSEMAIAHDSGDVRRESDEQRREAVPNHLDTQMEALAVQGSEETIQATSSITLPSSEQAHHVPTSHSTDEEMESEDESNTSAASGELGSFDWEDFEARYMNAMQSANDKELNVLKEFDEIVKFFNVWAAAASNHDNDRALKRLKTRESYVQNADRILEQKRQHHVDVVEAFKKALAMLGG